ncbi:MAG: Na+/H+ antiporter subunit E [Mesorhizobium sp.]|nr:Na+/H+ antiporter subunit E [Mesorhizobium sp.]
MASGLIFLKRFTVFLAVWLALSGASIAGLAFGIPTAVLAALASMRLIPAGGQRVNLIRVAGMAPGFLWQSVRGGVDVAWRALHPSLPISPGWQTWRTQLPKGGARVSLGSELSLLPGTLVAGWRDDVMYVHCLDMAHDSTDAIAIEEARISRAIGTAGDE